MIPDLGFKGTPLLDVIRPIGQTKSLLLKQFSIEKESRFLTAHQHENRPFSAIRGKQFSIADTT